MTWEAGEGTYTVGRGKPPAHTQFKPGQSGNPRGRPRGSADVREALLAAASETVIIADKGRKSRPVTKLALAARQLANKAASGHLPSMALLYKRVGSTLPVGPAAAPPADKADLSFGTEDDRQVLEIFRQRLLKEGSS